MKKIQDKTIVVWFSCGAASAVAAKKTLEKYGDKNNVLIVNNPIKEEHEDNLRFKYDVSKWLGVPIIEAKNKDYPDASIVEVFEKNKYMSGSDGAVCTRLLKREARYQFEKEHEIDWHVLGYTNEESKRHIRFTTFERANVIPTLIDNDLSKNDCFKYLINNDIKLPYVYKLLFPNANCIACVKCSSPTYWNGLIRPLYPEILKQRAEQSRKIGCKLVKYKGERIFLDELPPNATGGKLKSFSCSIFCDKY